MRAPLRLLLPLLVLAAACTDRASVTPPVTEPEPKPEPKILGVYDFTIEGIGTDEITSSAVRVEEAEDRTNGSGSASLTPVGNGLEVQQLTFSSVTDGTRGNNDGHRYITITYRVRNATGTPRTNVTFLAVSANNTVPGTPYRQLRRFDGSAADDSIARQINPTGWTLIQDGGQMISPVQDVLQVFDEPEVSGIALPVGITGTFPFGFVVRNAYQANTRLLPAATQSDEWSGVLTIAFRIPLQRHTPGSSDGPQKDVHILTFRSLAIEDSETRMTESIEESTDSAAVRRLRARATALGATTVTVLAGSPASSPTTANYPGQRQLCNVRTAGPPEAPTNQITARAWIADFVILRPGETLHPCAAGFRAGTPGRPATNVPFTVTVAAIDRYGNVKTRWADTVRIATDPASPPSTTSPATPLLSGVQSLTITYSDYGNSLPYVMSPRFRGLPQPIPVAGVVRTWTAGAGTTSWHTGGNWLNGAVPMSLDSVFIPAAAPLFPQLASNVTIRGVTVENGATISLGAFDLTAGANVATGTSGGINSSVGRVILTGTAATVRGTLPRLRVLGTYSLDGNVTAVAPTRVEAGRLRNGSFRVRTVSQ